MLVIQTVRIPVHYDVTKCKLSILDSLTAWRLGCGGVGMRELAIARRQGANRWFRELLRREPQLAVAGHWHDLCFRMDTEDWQASAA